MCFYLVGLIAFIIKTLNDLVEERDTEGKLREIKGITKRGRWGGERSLIKLVVERGRSKHLVVLI